MVQQMVGAQPSSPEWGKRHQDPSESTWALHLMCSWELPRSTATMNDLGLKLAVLGDLSGLRQNCKCREQGRRS